MYNKIKIQ